MSFGKAPKVPDIPAPPPPLRDVEPAVQQARDDERKRARAAAGYARTLLSDGTDGQVQAVFGRKTLLGS